MPFRLRANQHIGQELQRLFSIELDAAIDGLSTGSADPHDVRKHVKKARALLFARHAGESWRDRDTDRELKVTNRALGHLADARRMVQTVELLRGFDPALVPDRVFDQLRDTLLRRSRQIDNEAARRGTTCRAARLLISARQRSTAWDVAQPDRDAVIASIRRAHHHAADLRALVREQPTIASYHRWRRLVKLEWYLVRLVADYTGDRLRDDRHRLAALDGCLGELHDLNVLAGALIDEFLLTRPHTVRTLRALRALAGDRRRRAAELSTIFKDRPREISRRLAALWGIGRRVTRESAWPAIV